jgi:1,4-dihydroxy-2-naphthoate octaprenyltransferase
MACLLGGLIAYAHGLFNALYFIIALLGIAAVHLGTNLLDDYADLKASAPDLREQVQHESENPVRTVKAPYVLSGDITLNQLLSASFILFAIGIAACIFLTIKSGWPVAAIAAGGALISFFYSMPPLKFSYRGMGELVVSIALGPGVCLGTYYAVCGRFSWEPLFISLPLGILVGIILFVHSFMDSQPDTRAEKKTLATFIGGGTAMIVYLYGLLLSAYIIVVTGILLAILPASLLITLLSFPLALSLVLTIAKINSGRYTEIRAKWWMGPMEQMIEGHEWFLITWRQARNLLIFFTLLVIAGYAAAIITK